MSADPIADAENCIAVVIQSYIEIREWCKMALIRVGKDMAWTYVDMGVDSLGATVHEVTHVDDKFYAIGQRCRLLSFAESNPNLEIGCRHDTRSGPTHEISCVFN